MPKRTFIVQFGWCGFGRSASCGPRQPSEYRLGLIRVGVLRDDVLTALACYRDVLRQALAAIPCNDVARAGIARFLGDSETGR